LLVKPHPDRLADLREEATNLVSIANVVYSDGDDRAGPTELQGGFV
jgi:hypothetical protein